MNLWVVFAAVALVVVACSKDTPTSPSANATPTTVTETFSGTVNRNGAMTHNFTVAAQGSVTATLKELSPEITIGFALGTWNGTVCQVVLPRDQAVKTTVIYGNVNASGALCVRVYDVGNITAAEPASYEVEVIHP